MIDWSWWLHFAGGMVVGFIAMRVATRLCRRIYASLAFPWGCELSDSSTYDGPIEIKGIIDRRDPPPVVPGDKYAYTVKYLRRRWFIWPMLVAKFYVRFKADGTRCTEKIVDRRRCRVEEYVSYEDIQMRRMGRLECFLHGKDGCEEVRAARRKAEQMRLV